MKKTIGDQQNFEGIRESKKLRVTLIKEYR
jgi:hypothetical protein